MGSLTHNGKGRLKCSKLVYIEICGSQLPCEMNRVRGDRPGGISLNVLLAKGGGSTDRRSVATSQLCTAATTLTERQEKQNQTSCQRARWLTGWLLDRDGWRLIIGAGGPRRYRAGWHCTGPTPASINVVLISGTQHSSVSVHDSRNRLRLMKPGRGSRPVCRGPWSSDPQLGRWGVHAGRNGCEGGQPTA